MRARAIGLHAYIQSSRVDYTDQISQSFAYFLWALALFPICIRLHMYLYPSVASAFDTSKAQIPYESGDTYSIVETPLDPEPQFDIDASGGHMSLRILRLKATIIMQVKNSTSNVFIPMPTHLANKRPSLGQNTQPISRVSQSVYYKTLPHPQHHHQSIMTSEPITKPPTQHPPTPS